MMIGLALGIGCSGYAPAAGAPDTSPPVIVSVVAGTGGAQITGATNELLDGNSTPAANRFTLGGTSATVASVTVIDNTFILSLTGHVQVGEAVTVTYSVPSSGKIQDVAGNPMAALSSYSVTNNSTYQIVAPTLVASGQIDNTSGLTDTLDLTGVDMHAGDLILIHPQYRNSSTIASWSFPSGEGWALPTAACEEQATVAACGVGYKIWGKSGQTDDTTPTITWTAAGTVHGVGWEVWRNVDQTSPIVDAVRVNATAAATITSGVIAATPPVSTTVITWCFTDDNTPNGLSRGTLINSRNLNVVAAQARAYEANADAHTVTWSMNESTNGNDTCRVFTVVLRGGPVVAVPPYALTLLSATGYANARTNSTAFQESSVCTDWTLRGGVYRRYVAWYDRLPDVTSRLRLKCFTSADGVTWTLETDYTAPAGLNTTGASGDGHNSPSLGVDDTGRLVVIWQGHYQEFVYCYWRGSAPGDIAVASNTHPTGLPAYISYSKLFSDSFGLMLTGRLGAAGAGGGGTQALYELNSSTGAWTEVSSAMIQITGATPYMHHVHVNPADDTVHLAWVCAENQYTAAYRDLCYGQFKRTGAGGAYTFKSIDGTTRSLPLDDSAPFLAWDIPINSGLVVHHGLSCTAANVPLISVWYAKDGATDRTGGSNRYLVTRDAGAWVRQLVHQVHATWNLIDGNGSQTDPNAANNEYQQVSQATVLYAAAGGVHLVYRSNYQLGSAGVPCVMLTSSFAAPYSVWTTPSILVDTPVGDVQPTHDANAWNHQSRATFLVSLLDIADQYPGGAASNVQLADCTLPTS